MTTSRNADDSSAPNTTEPGTTFSRLAASLSRCRFESPLPEHHERLAGGLAESTASSSLRPHNCCKLSNQWYVKFYFARSQRTWAILPYIKYSEAFRLADMIRYYLHVSGARVIRTKAPLSDADFNLGLDQARRDYTRESKILSIIIQMRFAFGEDAQPRKQRVVSRAPRTVSAQFESFANRLSDIESALTRIERKLAVVNVYTLPTVHVGPEPQHEPTTVPPNIFTC